MKRLVALLTLSVGLWAADKANGPKEADQAWATAAVKGDAAGLESVLADDLVYVHSNGKEDNKASYVASVKEGKTKYHKLDLSEVRERMFGNIAVVHSKAHIETTSNGVSNNFDGYLLHVLQKKNGRWQLIAHQSTRIQK